MERLIVSKEPTRHERITEVVDAIINDDPSATDKLLKLADEVSKESMDAIKSKLLTIK